MIAGALLTMLASGAYFAGSSIKTNVNIYKNAERMNDEGASWKSDVLAEIAIRRDIARMWEEGKRDFVPEELVELFENDLGARSAYFDGLAAECMILQGFKPKDAESRFNRYTYDCYSQYNQLYNGNMNEWLRINRPAIMRKKLDDLNQRKKEAQEAHMKYLRKKNRIYVVVMWFCLIAIMVGIFLISYAQQLSDQAFSDWRQLEKKRQEISAKQEDEYYGKLRFSSDMEEVGINLILFVMPVMMIAGPLWIAFRNTHTVEDGCKECWNDFVKWLNTQSQRAKERRAELKK